MSIWDILLLVIVAVLVISCIRTIKKRSKNMGCGGGCAGCTMHDCPSKQMNLKDKE
jgi:hypothetical protein